MTTSPSWHGERARDAAIVNAELSLLQAWSLIELAIDINLERKLCTFTCGEDWSSDILDVC